MKKKWLAIFVLVAVFACGLPKVIDYAGFKNGQENLFNWVQSFATDDIEEIGATIFREGTAPQRYSFSMSEAEVFLDILKSIPKESFIQISDVKTLNGISVYICRWRFDATAKSDLLLTYDNGITTLGFTSELKEKLFIAPERENWAIQDETLSAFMEQYMTMLETGYHQRSPFTATDSGYVYHADVEKISMALLSDNMQTVSAEIVQQFAERDAFSSQSPNSWRREFSIFSEARDYIGYSALRGIEWPLEEKHTELRITGDQSGKLQSLTLETTYQVDDIHLQASALLCTEHDKEACTIETIEPEDIQYQESADTTEIGRLYHVMTTTARPSGYCTMEGYLVIEGVLYHLHIAYLEQDAEQAGALLHQWAEQFD